MAADMLPDTRQTWPRTAALPQLVVANELTRESHIDIVIEVTDAEEAASEYRYPEWYVLTKSPAAKAVSR